MSVTEGEVPAQKSLDLTLTYRPANLLIKDEKNQPAVVVTKDAINKDAATSNINKPNLVTQILNQLRQDEDKLVIKITDGIE